MQGKCLWLLLCISLIARLPPSSAREHEDEFRDEPREREEDLDEDATDSDGEDGEVGEIANRLYKRLLEEKRNRQTNTGSRKNKYCKDYNSENCGKQFLRWYSYNSAIQGRRASVASFNYETDMTKENAAKVKKAKLLSRKWFLKSIKKARKFRWRTFRSPSEKRAFKLIVTTFSTTNQNVAKELMDVQLRMKSVYANGKPCFDGTCLQPGEKGIKQFMAKSRDYRALQKAWKSWSDVTGNKMRKDFSRMIKLLNKGAKENGYPDYGYAEWFEDTEEKDFNSLVLHLFEKLRPLYEQVHAYVRAKLAKKYPGEFAPDGLIPAHIFGNVWGQLWLNIFDLVQPYPNSIAPNITKSLLRKGYTPRKMFKTAEKFYISIGLPAMTKTFWKKSVIERPKTKIECHGSATNLEDYNHPDDFRIKMCTEVTINDLQTVHHEMGHVEYYMAYADQPAYFRSGAQSGFHEAIGDTIGLSFQTNKHYELLGFLEDEKISSKSDLNVLMQMALQKVVFLPYALVVDTFRWRTFNGTISDKNYNHEWWALISKFQGLGPPVKRSEKDFDPGSKYHVAANVAYIRYFMSFILQFQFYEAMCKEAGHKGPLHRCDFYGSKPSGQRLEDMMKLGASKPWSDALEVMTGERKLDTSSLIRYFQPLMDWLKRENSKNKTPIGWKIPKNSLLPPRNHSA